MIFMKNIDYYYDKIKKCDSFEDINSLSISTIENYVVPGLYSFLLTEKNEDVGCIRAFMQTLHQEYFVTPHSHRYNHEIIMIKGECQQILYEETSIRSDDYSQFYRKSTIEYLNSPGKYRHSLGGHLGQYVRRNKRLEEGQRFRLNSDEIHSIFFNKGAIALIKEGPDIDCMSYILQPIAKDELINTFQVNEWAFRKIK